MFALAAMIAIVFHEVAHGFVALKNGDMTAKYAGRLSLNPAKHFDLMGILMFAFIGIGWARPVPVNPVNFKRQRLGMFGVAIAGVVTNFLLALVAFVLLCLVGGVFSNEIVNLCVFSFLEYTVVINLCLIAFNILPIYPLDGFRVVESFTKTNNKYCVFMRRYGTTILFGLFIADIVLSQFHYGPLSLYIEFVRDSILQLFSWVGGWLV